MQLDIDFRLHYPTAINAFLTDFPGLAKGIIAAARLSPRTGVTDLLREYDSVEHSPNVTPRDYMFATLLLLKLLPSSNTRQKAKVSSVELEQCLICFRPQQTSIELFISQKKQKQPFLLCLGTKEEPGPFYLILDTKAVCLGTCGVVRAIDALFKAHYVYWVGYARPVELFMEFIQKLVFKIECNAKLTPRVRELHNTIKTLTTTDIEPQTDN